MIQLLSTCHNAPIIGSIDSPSGDPIRCSQCGEICGQITMTTPEEKILQFPKYDGDDYCDACIEHWGYDLMKSTREDTIKEYLGEFGKEKIPQEEDILHVSAKALHECNARSQKLIYVIREQTIKDILREVERIKKKSVFWNQSLCELQQILEAKLKK